MAQLSMQTLGPEDIKQTRRQRAGGTALRCRITAESLTNRPLGISQVDVWLASLTNEGLLLPIQMTWWIKASRPHSIRAPHPHNTPFDLRPRNTHAPCTRDSQINCRCRASPNQRRTGRVADRNRLRPCRRRNKQYGGCQNFCAKGRPHLSADRPFRLPLDAAMEVVELPDYAHKLAQELWPGPLTLVAPLKPSTTISALARDGGDTLAVRVPRPPNELQRLLSAFPQGLVAPSANPSGKLSPTTASHVHQGLGERVDLVLDAGPA